MLHGCLLTFVVFSFWIDEPRITRVIVNGRRLGLGRMEYDLNVFDNETVSDFLDIVYTECGCEAAVIPRKEIRIAVGGQILSEKSRLFDIGLKDLSEMDLFVFPSYVHFLFPFSP
jgi:uncharacterized ubiquitin-like protein YukD